MAILNVLTIDQLMTYLEKVKQTYGKETLISIAATDGGGDAYSLAGGGIDIDKQNGQVFATIFAPQAVTGSPTIYANDPAIQFPPLVIMPDPDDLNP